jgi:hypothetical protein
VHLIRNSAWQCVHQESEGYIVEMQPAMGPTFELGKGDGIESMRLRFDDVHLACRSLLRTMSPHLGVPSPFPPVPQFDFDFYDMIDHRSSEGNGTLHSPSPASRTTSPLAGSRLLQSTPHAFRAALLLARVQFRAPGTDISPESRTTSMSNRD